MRNSEQLTPIYSPYRGKVRRVKILGQNERSINIEVTLNIEGWKIGRSLSVSRFSGFVSDKFIPGGIKMYNHLL